MFTSAWHSVLHKHKSRHSRNPDILNISIFNMSTKLPLFTSVPCEEHHGLIFNHLFSILETKYIPRLYGHIQKHEHQNTTPAQFSLSPALHMSQATVIETINSILEEYFETPETNQSNILQAPLDPLGAVGDIISTLISSPMVTYFFAPVPTLMEFQVLHKLRKLINYASPETGDGIFVPGSVVAALAAIKLAIQQKYPKVKTVGILEGLDKQLPLVFVSEKNFHTYRKACVLAGLDAKSCTPIKVNPTTQSMDIESLRSAVSTSLREGYNPLMIVATLGTSDSLHFDPLQEIQSICTNLNLWFHVDGFIGGPYIFSQTLRTSHLKALEHSDSFTLGMETLLGAPSCATCLITRHPSLCSNAFGLQDKFLFGTAELYNRTFDRGANTFMTARRADVLKIWLMWKFYGTTGLGTKVETIHSQINQLGNQTALNFESKLDTILPIYSETFKFILQNCLFYENSKDNPINFQTPEDLALKFDFSLPTSPVEDIQKELHKVLQGIINFSNKIPHPKYIFQLTCGGLDPFAIVGDILATFTSARNRLRSDQIQLHMEQEIFKCTRELIGYPHSPPISSHYDFPGNGLLCPGASCSIISAMYAAKYFKMSTLSTSNALKGPLKFYMSKNAHNCYKKAAIVLGIGVNNCVIVDVDKDGKISASALRNALIETLKSGGIPFMVGATAGTTCQGVFDFIPEISKVCKEFGLWLHVDGSFGGSIIFSKRLTQKYMSGAHLADSFNFNSHKWFGSPTECSILLFKEPNFIQKVFGNLSNFNSFQMASGIQNERRNNSLKFWLTLKAKGTEGLREHIEYSMQLKYFLINELQRPQRSQKFKVWKDDFETPAVLFQYIPRHLRQLQNFESDDTQKQLGTAAENIHTQLIQNGSVAVGLFKDGNSPFLLRFMLMSSGITETGIIAMLNVVEECGEELDGI